MTFCEDELTWSPQVSTLVRCRHVVATCCQCSLFLGSEGRGELIHPGRAFPIDHSGKPPRVLI
jgi:hypothetical protein